MTDDRVIIARDRQLYNNALNAITAMFSNTDVPRMVTKENLKDLMAEIESMLDSLEEG